MGWFFEDREPPRDTASIAKVFCPAVLSMRLAAQQAEAAMVQLDVPVPPIEQLLVTNRSTLPAEIREFMTARGVSVMEVDDDALQGKVRSTWHGGKNWRHIVNVMKLAPLWRADWGYAAVHVIDWDNFFLGPVDLLTPSAHRGLAFVRPGRMTPTNGGLAAMRPSLQVRDSVAHALEHGFSYRDGWGGNYSLKDLALSKAYSDRYCLESPGNTCCKEVPRSPWCFAASDVDQGLLFHLMIDGGRKSACPPFGDDCPSFNCHHATLQPKPWELEEMLRQVEQGTLHVWPDSVSEYYSSIDRFWNRVGPLAERMFRNDQVCGTFFDGQHELYHQRLAPQNTAFFRQPVDTKRGQQRKPVMWVHVHKNGGTSMCEWAQDTEQVVEPNDGTCNSVDLHDTFFPDGIGQKRQWTTCADRAEYFRDHRFTWGQLEREINPGDLCKDDFLYGITLRDPVSRIESYANWNSNAVNGAEWKGYMSCIQRRNASACPAVEGRPIARVNWGYREWDNFNIRVLGGYDVMRLPPGGVNASHLAAAVDLLEQFDLVLLLEDLESGCTMAEMKRVLGWSPKGESPHARENDHSQVVFTEGQRAAWARINRFDVQLYTHFAQRRPASSR